MGKALSHMERAVKNTAASPRAMRLVGKLEKGKAKVTAPHYLAEEKYFREAQEDDSIKEEVLKKYDGLDGNLREIDIEVTYPPERPLDPDPARRRRYLPTREAEEVAGKDPEFRFHEPPEADIPADKLTFREAIELMRLNVEIREDPKKKSGIQAQIDAHSASHRVSAEKLAKMQQFFSPFVRKGIQQAVKKEYFDRPDYLKYSVEDNLANWDENYLVTKELEAKQRSRLEAAKFRQLEEEEDRSVEEGHKEARKLLEDAKKKLIEERDRAEERRKEGN